MIVEIVFTLLQSVCVARVTKSESGCDQGEGVIKSEWVGATLVKG